MKKTVCFLLLVLLSMSVFMAFGKSGTGLSMLRADGKALVNEAGEKVLLRGVNAGGWLIQENWMNLTNAPSQLEAFSVLDERFGKEKREALFKVYEDNYWLESDFDNIKALGMNVVRLPFAWWNIVTDEGMLREDAFARLDWFVGECAERGMYVVLDLHAAPGSQNGNDHSGDITGSHLWDSEENMALTEFIWKAVAQHYNGNPAVCAYDLLNEPGGKLNKTG
ncbi:MAG: cellulase family glycosylhydrolase, partial [Clostridia bacterium]|nr:cellulase family glycosylhydrolase [Clostridia bacterium]